MNKFKEDLKREIRNAERINKIIEEERGNDENRKSMC